MEKKRKIIQIAIDTTEQPGKLWALCDDGTIWDREWDTVENYWTWTQFPTIEINQDPTMKDEDYL